MTKLQMATAGILALAACAPVPGHEGPITVSTTEAHRAELEAAVGRWVAAGGVELVIVDEGEGTPVHFASQVFRDGAEVCGRAELADNGQAVVALHVATAPQVSCTPGRGLMHELGHLLEIQYSGDAHDVHLDEGSATLLAPSGKVTWITVDDLLFVCSAAPCSTFVNEQRPR